MWRGERRASSQAGDADSGTQEVPKKENRRASEPCQGQSQKKPMKDSNPSPPVKPSTLQVPEGRLAAFADKPVSPEAKETGGTKIVPIDSSTGQVIPTAPVVLVPETDIAGQPIPELTRDEKLVMALMGLVTRLEEIQNHDGFKSIFKAAKSQGIAYSGPTWADPLKNAKTVLEGK